MNSVVRQLWEQNTDVVMVDTGNSYEGLCEYVGGKYISYTEEKPITMNPFRINREELNVERTGFLKNLVLLIWKGSQGTVTKTEDRLIDQVITEYYDTYFNGFTGFTPPLREDLRKSLIIDDRNRSHQNPDETEAQREERLERTINQIEQRRKELKVESLSFNTFYEFSVQRIPDICSENSIGGIDISTYRYMMKDFYRGGNHDKTLNENMDSSLFDETFIVFEIDAIKDDPLLFPIVTLIIMDVFLQKMRIKKNRKVLVIEEAWKAIASPLMAEYIKYLYKTARKFWASVGVVTQEIQDIIGSEIVKEAIINNSDVVMLLDQSKFKERFDTIKSILGLTDVDCKKIFTINRLERTINQIEQRRKELKVESLSFNTFYEFSVQRIPDICSENSIGGIDISTYRYMMKDFYRGGNHDKTLNENMDSSLFDETFIVFEIDAIKDDPLLFPIVTLIIMDVFLQKMRIKKNRKVLVIEEAWKAIASPLMAEYIKYLYKTARKFWASVGVVTQEIQDIIGSEIVKEAIINNSDVVMLLDQSKFKERFDTIKSILGLTDVDCKKIFTINRLENKDGRSFFREVFIRRGSTSNVYGVEEPHECYMTYTTERAEKEALKLYKSELQCSHQEAIEAYCRDWDASGISKSLPFAQKVNQAGHVLNLSTRKTKE